MSVGEDRLWSSRVDDYLLQAWTLSGEPISQLRRNEDWFKPPRLPREEGDASPLSGVLDLHIRADGLILVLLEVEDADWKEGIEFEASGHGHEVTDWNRYVDTVLEVLTPDGRVVLGHQRFDVRMTQILDDHRLASFTEGVGIEVWRIEIDTYSTGGNR